MFTEKLYKLYVFKILSNFNKYLEKFSFKSKLLHFNDFFCKIKMILDNKSEYRGSYSNEMFYKPKTNKFVYKTEKKNY